MTPLVIVGAGGFGRETAQLASSLPEFSVRGFLDDDAELAGASFSGVPVLGPISALSEHPDAKVVVTIGNPERYDVRRTIVERVGLSPGRYATLIHPTTAISADSTVGHGSVVLANCSLTANVTVGSHVVVMPNAVMTHDDVIEDFCTIGAGTILAGGVSLGSGAYIGAGVSIRENVRIGKGARIGMGAVVTRDVPPTQTWVGVPAKPT